MKVTKHSLKLEFGCFALSIESNNQLIPTIVTLPIKSTANLRNEFRPQQCSGVAANHIKLIVPDAVEVQLKQQR